MKKEKENLKKEEAKTVGENLKTLTSCLFRASVGDQSDLTANDRLATRVLGLATGSPLSAKRERRGLGFSGFGRALGFWF